MISLQNTVLLQRNISGCENCYCSYSQWLRVRIGPKSHDVVSTLMRRHTLSYEVVGTLKRRYVSTEQKWKFQSLNKWMVDNGHQVGIYLFKVHSRNTRTRCKICLKLTIKTQERRHWRRYVVSIVNFEHISHLALVYLLLNLNM